jgi:predicted molibdopterin-dependent oxidoreductase YjgC
VKFECIPTTCIYCGCGCSVVLQVLDGQLIGVLPGKTNLMNDGRLCIKGWTSHEFVQSEKRLKHPLIKKDGAFVETSWDYALGEVARRLKSIGEESGPDSIAALASAKCTNEENYLLQKFVRAVIGTNNVDHCARL